MCSLPRTHRGHPGKPWQFVRQELSAELPDAFESSHRTSLVTDRSKPFPPPLLDTCRRRRAHIYPRKSVRPIHRADQCPRFAGPCEAPKRSVSPRAVLVRLRIAQSRRDRRKQCARTWQCCFAQSTDRKSTRLNSSTSTSSYADFCLNKK